MTGHLSSRIAHRVALVTSLALVAGGLSACTAVTASTGSAPTTATIVTGDSTFWDATAVHVISIDIADADYQALIAAYLATGEKQWATATVTIDGTVLENVGIKLKGNSTLRGVSADADPATLPWLIDLNKYVDGQSYLDATEIVVRGNNSTTALNEAVALELLGDAGLATQEAVSSRFSVNGGSEKLRLLIQNPDDGWVEQEFGDDGPLYKAQAGGDYTYRGDDAESYTDVFEQEAGDDDIAPLAAFLKFINESDDATFAVDLDKYLDVKSFATYLAFQDLVDNFDDIAGPGNNSYLHYDADSGLMTVVSWDLNLALGVSNGGGGGQGGNAGQGNANQAGPPAGGKGGQPGGAGGPGRTVSNVLADRFMANSTFSALYDTAKSDLTASLFTSGTAQAALDAWTAVLTAQAGDLVSTDEITKEAASVATYFD